MVVSGQNLTFVAGFFWALSGLIKRKLAIVLALSATIFYTILTGAQIPVLRALLMVSIAMLAQTTGRQKDSLWALIVTGALMLLINPMWISDLSFQLSFMATMGLVLITPILLRRLKNMPLIGQELAVTTGAQLMVIPIIAQNFHQFSVVGIVTNILVGWAIPFIMVLGFPIILFGFISESLSSIFAFLTNLFLSYFIYVVEFFANLPFSWEYVGEKVWVFWVGYYLILAAVMLLLNNDKTRNSETP